MQYNGCKWKGGLLRVEKAKEHYIDRLRREWAEAEAEAAPKAKVAENAAAMAITQSRDMYSFTPDYEDVSRSPESNTVEFEEVIAEQGTRKSSRLLSLFCNTQANSLYILGFGM